MTLAQNAAAMLASNSLVRALGMATAVLARRGMGPAGAGAWSLIQAATGYAVAVHSGTVFGAERDIPFRRGQGDRAGEESVRRHMFAVAIGESLVLALLIGALAFSPLGDAWPPPVRAGAGWIALYVVLWRLSECFLVSFRTVQAFIPLARLQLAFAAADLVLAAALTLTWGLRGQCIAFAASLGLRIALMARTAARGDLFPAGARVDPRLWRPLLAVGAPLVLNNAFWQLLITVDGLIVAKGLGLASLGFYSLGVTLGRTCGEVVASFASVVSPRMVENFGREEDPRRLVSDMMRYMEASVCFLLPALGSAAVFLAPPAVRLVLNDFLPAVPAFCPLFFASAALALANIPAQVFIARKRTGLYTGMTVLGVALTAAAAGAAVRSGVAATAAAVAAAQGLWLALLSIAALKLGEAEGGEFRRLAALALAVAYVAGTLLLLDKGLSMAGLTAGGFPHAAAGLAGSLLLFFPLFRRVDREFRLLERIRGRLGSR